MLLDNSAQCPPHPPTPCPHILVHPIRRLPRTSLDKASVPVHTSPPSPPSQVAKTILDKAAAAAILLADQPPPEPVQEQPTQVWAEGVNHGHGVCLGGGAMV